VIALLDVNVLVALLDSAHLNHDEAHAWFGRNRSKGWATCPITLNGCARVLSNPGYPTVDTTVDDVNVHLRAMCEAAAHHFWPDSISLLDERLFQPRKIGGYQKITDVYLLALSVVNRGRLVTFDRSISLSSVHGAKGEHLEILGGQKSS
jgi:toxin-antitoxin system PIN domain toxin